MLILDPLQKKKPHDLENWLGIFEINDWKDRKDSGQYDHLFLLYL